MDNISFCLNLYLFESIKCVLVVVVVGSRTDNYSQQLRGGEVVVVYICHVNRSD